MSFDGVEIKILEKKNRSLVAKRNFVKDEVIFTEKPIVCAQFAWNEFYKYKACEYCMRPLETAEENVRRLCNSKTIKLPYQAECDEIVKSNQTACYVCHIEYCSEQCRLDAYESYHKIICLGVDHSNPSHPFNILMDTWRQMHMPPETTTLTLIVKLIAMVNQASDKNIILQKLSNFESDLVSENEQMPHKLLNKSFFNDIELLRQIFYDIYQRVPHFHVKECEYWLKDSIAFRKLFCLIGRNSQGVGTSPLSVWVNNCSTKLSISSAERKKLEKFIDKMYSNLDKVSGAFLNSEGCALFELQSMANHSCKPNAEIQFKYNNHILSLCALEDIKPGDEITISYLDECELYRSRHSRQKALRENYLFNCECERCVSEASQADVTSDEDADIDDDEEEFEDIDDDDDEEAGENNQEEMET